jgi:glycosyltransferase involved in cell wall biosynthesis
MRILKVSRCYFPATEYGGPIGKMLAITRGLTERGHDVTVYTSNLLSPKDKMSDTTSTRQIDAARIVYLNSVVNYHWDAITPDVFGLCRRELRDFEVIHVYGYRDFISTIVCWHARRWRIPYLIEPMGMFKPIVRSVTEKRLYDWIYGDRLTAGAAGVIATSQAEREELSLRGVDPRKIVIRRNGIDLEGFAPPPQPGGFRRRLGLESSDRLVLYLGRISKKKGIDLLVRSLCDERLAEIHLAVVGSDDYDGHLDDLRDLVAGSALQARVTFTGPLYGQDKVQALHDSDVLVLPSASENFGNVVAEAVACGTPVIVTDRCGIAPFVLGHDHPAGAEIQDKGPSPDVPVSLGRPATNGDGGAYDIGRVGIVIPFAEGALREALVRTFTDDGLISSFRHNAGEAAAELSWEEPIEQMETLYNSVVMKPGTESPHAAPACTAAGSNIGDYQRRQV